MQALQMLGVTLAEAKAKVEKSMSGQAFEVDDPATGSVPAGVVEALKEEFEGYGYAVTLVGG